MTAASGGENRHPCEWCRQDGCTPGTTKPLTLRALRERIEADDKTSLFALLDVDEGDSCNCMGDYTDTPVTIGRVA